MEIWKTIDVAPNYSVSNLGRFRNDKTGKILKTTKNKVGYAVIGLKISPTRKKTFNAHTLVARAFLPNPEGLKELNHIDENKLNNRVDNLEWCTRKYNLNYGHHLEHYYRKIKCVETNIVYPSITDAAKAVGGYVGNIIKSARGQLKTCAGYHWEYVDKKKI